MYRRQLGLSVAGLSLAAALAGCAGVSVATIPSIVIADLGLIKNGLSVILGLAQSVGMSPALSTTITTDAGRALSAISTVAEGMSLSLGKSIIEQIVTDTNAVLAALNGSGLTFSPTITQVISALTVLGRVVAASIGLIGAGGPGAPSPESVTLSRQVLGTV